MFSNPLPDDEDYRVVISGFAERYYLKRFAKDYKGKRWLVTFDSIRQDLRRVHALQHTQQVDELKHRDSYILFKYDFAVAQSNISAKASGNRCVVFLDMTSHTLTVLIVYGKNDLPKNKHETQWLYETIQANHQNLWSRL